MAIITFFRREGSSLYSGKRSILKQVAAVGNIFFLSSSVFVIVNNGFKLRKPPRGTREQPVENL